MGSTHGAWLRGDPRGWRSRHHREHVEGDYRCPPPPGAHEQELAQSLRSMRRPPVVLDARQRETICLALVQRLRELSVEVVALCVCGQHFHLLARFSAEPCGGHAGPSGSHTAVPGLRPQNALQDGRDPLPRHLLGLARKHASHVLRQQGLTTGPGGVWGVRTQITPIRDRQHQVNVARYIHGHVRQGAAVWTVMRGYEGPC